MNYQVRQDGASFYLYSNGEGLIATVTAPVMIRDFELTKAEQARQWFITLADTWGLEISWPLD